MKLSLVANRENDSTNLMEMTNQLEKIKIDYSKLRREYDDKIRTIKNLDSKNI